MRYLFIVLLLFLGCDDNPASPQIEGCTDVSACNYDDTATTNDESCTYAEENFDCDNNCIVDLDCANQCGGTATLDECGVCNGSGAIENFDCNGNCLVYVDCSSVCGGDNTACEDCNGVQNGTAYLDNCNTCDSIPGNDCVQDCSGTWGGNATYDLCGNCDDNPSNDCVNDCNGILGGTAFIDNCNQCVEGTTGLTENYLMDECNVCNGSGIPESECDCNGNVLDDCDVCGGNNSTCTGCTNPEADNYCSNCIIEDDSCESFINVTIYNPSLSPESYQINLFDINTTELVQSIPLYSGTYNVLSNEIRSGTYYITASFNPYLNCNASSSNCQWGCQYNFGAELCEPVPLLPDGTQITFGHSDIIIAGYDQWTYNWNFFEGEIGNYIEYCSDLTQFPFCIQP